jgi:hypothetical protein
MKKVIEVYIKNEELPVQPIVYQGVPGHPCTIVESYRTEKVIPEADRLTLKLAEEVSKKEGVELKVYDITSFRGKVQARMKGIKNTPTIVIGKNKIEGIPEKERLLAFLK